MTPVMVSFSQEGAFNYLNRLVANRLISLNQYAVVEREIITSCLPIELPPDIRQLVGECVAWEEKVVEFASIDQEEAARFTLLGTDIAEAVHEYLLKSSGHLWLRMH